MWEAKFLKRSLVIIIKLQKKKKEKERKKKRKGEISGRGSYSQELSQIWKFLANQVNQSVN